jgi:hypothetical protein
MQMSSAQVCGGMNKQTAYNSVMLYLNKKWETFYQIEMY